MPPKRQKSGGGSAGGGNAGLAGGPNTSQYKWEAGLVGATFNDDEWKAAVAIVVPLKAEDRKNMQILQEAVAGGSRRLFSVVEPNEMFKVAQELGNPKQKKEKNTPAFFEVNELIKQYLDQNEAIPVQIMARLIKWHLLSIKANDLKRREEEKKSADKGKAGAKAAPGGKKGGDRQKSAAGKGGKDKGKGGAGSADVPPAPRKETKLRKRGEEDDDSKYIDDEPDDGPQHYVMIFGQSDALLVQALNDIGVYVDVVVCLKTDDYVGYDPKPLTGDESGGDGKKEDDKNKYEEPLTKAQIAMMAQNELERAEREKHQQTYSRFWFELPIILKQAPPKSKIRDTVQLDHQVDFESIPKSVDFDLDIRGGFGADLFETSACLLYDMFDWKRQYFNYLENTHFQNIPEITNSGAHNKPAPLTARGEETSAPAKTAGGGDKPGKKGGAGHGEQATPRKESGVEGVGEDQVDSSGSGFLDLSNVDLNFYNDLLGGVPSECVSVELLLHSLLEQVSATTCSVEDQAEEKGGKGAGGGTREDGLDASLAEHLSGLFLKLALSDEEKKAIEKKLGAQTEAEKQKSETKLINFRDNLSLRLQSLKGLHGFDPVAAEKAMLSLTPSAALLNYPKPAVQEQREIAARFQDVMMHCAHGSMTQSEVNHALKQFIFECIKLKETDEQGNVQNIPPSEGNNLNKDFIVPWDDPHPFLEKHQEPPPRVVEEGGDTRSSVEGSRPGSSVQGTGGAGILKRAPSAASSKGASVSFAEEKTSGTGVDTSATPKAVTPDQVDVPDLVDLPGGPNDKISEDDASLPQDVNSPQPPSLDKGAQFMAELSSAQLRNLDQWCYMEHFERDTLIQVLEESRYNLPYLEVYYCRKDNTLLLTLYCATNGDCFNSSDWFSYLHTDVGFRNYLDYIQDKIKEWTEKEEEKYLFALAEKERLAAMSPGAVAAEVAAANEEAAAGRGKTGGGKRSRSQSPKTGRKGSGNRSKSPKNKEEESEEEKDDGGAGGAGGISKQFMRPNSMKVWKLEQDKIKEAEEKKRQEKEKAAAGGGGKGKASAKKGGSPAGSRDGSRSGSRSGSRGGASRSPSKERKGKKGGKGDTKKGNDESTASNEKTEVPLPDAVREAINKEFRGYKLGDELVHCVGKTSNLFACDGAQIRVESTKFYEGPSHVRLTLLEGKNVLSLHLGDPLPLDPSEGASEGGPTGVSGDTIHSSTEGAGVTSESFDKKKDTSSESQDNTATADNVASSMKMGNSMDSSKQLEISISKATPTLDESEQHGPVADDGTNKKNKKDKKKGPSEYGSFTAKLSDGINLSFSCYGHSGLNPDIEKAIKCIDMKAPTPPTAAAPEVKPEKGGSAKGKKGKASAGKKGKNTAPAPETPPPAPTTPPAGEKGEGDGALPTRGTDATGLLGQDEMDQAAQMGHLQARDFQQLHVSAPNGLTINYYLEKSNEVDSVLQQEDFSSFGNSLLIEQCYPFKGDSSCQQQAQNEGVTNSTAWKEKTRLITSQGNVIKLLQNGKIEVLCADGTRLEYSGPWIDPNVVLANLAAGGSLGGVEEPSTHRPDSQGSDPEKTSRPGTASKKGTAKSPTRKSPRPPGQEGAAAGGADGSSGAGGAQGGPAVKELDPHERGIITWTYVTGIGERLVTNGKGEREKREDLKYYTASDPETMEVLMVREDRVMMVSRPDNSLIVDHNDGTRITTFYKEQQLPGGGADPTVHEVDPLNEASSRQVRFVKIECDGFATLVFNTEDSSCTTFFGSQTNLFAHPTGLYVSSCADGSAIVINQKGEVVYVGKPDNEVIGYLCNCETFDKLPEDVLKSNVYVLKHDQSYILNHVDSTGAMFKVNAVGEVKIDNSLKKAENPDDQVETSCHPKPRYFILNPDQSGDELIRHDDVIGLLQQSEQDPATVVLVDPLPEHPNIKGVTVMQPSFTDSLEKWALPRDEANIIPKNLTSRDLKTIPPKEYKKPGPKFGTNVGKGLNVGSLKPSPETEETVPVYPKIPDTVTLRQFVGYPEVKEELRTALKEGFKSYCETVDQNATYAKSIKKVDPRSAEEIERSLEMERKMNERWLSKGGADVGNDNPFNSSIMREKTGNDTSKVTKLYQEATKPVSPPPQKRAQPKRTGSAWERDKNEVELERDNRLKLRNKEIPPYFQSYLGRDFVEKQKQLALNKELQDATGDLPYYENKKRMEKISKEEESVNNTESGQEKHEEEAPEKESKDVEEKTDSAAQQNQDENGSNSEQEMQIEPFTHNYYSVPETPPFKQETPDDQSEISARGVNKHRSMPPYKVPNEKFFQIEDPVKRKSNTTAIAGAAEPTLLGALRGFMLRPRKVNFGVLREGYTYGVNLVMRNIGLDNCRFRIKNPPPSTGLSASYKPGPVAAGMSQQIQLVLFALANPTDNEPNDVTKDEATSQAVVANQNSPTQHEDDSDDQNRLLHHLVITTEAEIFNVPVLAKVLPANEYDSNYRSSETGIHGHSNLVYIISTEPTAPRNPIKRDPTGGAGVLKPVK